MKIKQITSLLNDWAPLSYAEDFDNVGLLVGDEQVDCTGVLITLDCLETVVDEAIASHCNLIVTFHPIIFKGLKRINKSTYVERVVFKALQHNIAIFALHTALDNVPHGVNFGICQKLGLTNTKTLIPKSPQMPTIGMGMTGSYDTPLEIESFITLVKERFAIPTIRHSALISKTISKVGVLGGSGSFAIQNAIQANCDVFLTADLKYHDFFTAESKIILMDIGHYESEQFTKNLIWEYLTKKIPNFVVLLSKTNTNPIQYS